MKKRSVATLVMMMVTSLISLKPMLADAQQVWKKVEVSPGTYEMVADTTDSKGNVLVATVKSQTADDKIFGALMQNVSPQKFLSKRVRLTAYVKLKNVNSWGGLWMRVDKKDSKMSSAFDNMQDRPLTGSSDWNKYEIVLDVHAEATNIAFGIVLNGTGELSVCKVTMEEVDKQIPSTGTYINNESR